jgi:hypothetical protein
MVCVVWCFSAEMLFWLPAESKRQISGHFYPKSLRLFQPAALGGKNWAKGAKKEQSFFVFFGRPQKNQKIGWKKIALLQPNCQTASRLNQRFINTKNAL